MLSGTRKRSHRFFHSFYIFLNFHVFWLNMLLICSFLGASISSIFSFFFFFSFLCWENDKTTFSSFEKTIRKRFPHLRKRWEHDSLFSSSFLAYNYVILYYSSYFSSLKGFLYYSNPTGDSLLFLSQRISLLFQSDRGLFIVPLSKDFFTIPLSKDFFTIPVRQDSLLSLSQRIPLLFQSDRILYYSSLKGFLYYSNPTTDSLFVLSQRIPLLFLSQGISLLFLSQRIALLSQSDKGFFITPLS